METNESYLNELYKKNKESLLKAFKETDPKKNYCFKHEEIQHLILFLVNNEYIDEGVSMILLDFFLEFKIRIRKEK